MPKLRLDRIKLSGFKSFAEPTTLKMTGDITAVVGPNGCGKSNIVDAIRWVIGETSAKQLRGGSMSDVIFNGTTHRAPMAQASIELVFDNRDGRIGGAYAGYSVISVRREVSREGQSSYFLNNTRCRRKDILDIFMGTGLGPRSYAIIEQGVISRLIEAKPEELRVHLEEVAGITKYKERRRETENRISHTKENLDRLNDRLEEMGKQLAHLKRQASAAERYQVLKEEERLLKAQLQALYFSELTQEFEQNSASIKTLELELDAKVADQRGLGAQLEDLRERYTDQSDRVNEVQAKYYSMGADIARIEQQISSYQEREQQLEENIARLTQNKQEASVQLTEDENQIRQLTQLLAELTPQVEAREHQTNTSQQALQTVEEAMQAWQQDWDAFTEASAQAAQKAEVAQARIMHLEDKVHEQQSHLSRLEAEHEALDFKGLNDQIAVSSQESADLQFALEQLQQQTHEMNDAIQHKRQDAQSLRKALDETQQQLTTARGRKTSLEALQQVALGQDDQPVVDWLEKHQLTSHARLAKGLRVAPGWENAVETVLGPHLEAVCVKNIKSVTEILDSLTDSNISFFDTEKRRLQPSHTSATPLVDKIDSDWPLSNLLAGVYVVENLAEALVVQEQLAAHESVVTKDGLWFGRTWLRVMKRVDEKSGVIERESHLKQVNDEIATLHVAFLSQEKAYEQAKSELAGFEQQRDQLQEQYHEVSAKYRDVHGKFSGLQARIEQLRQRETSLLGSIEEGREQLFEAREQLAESSETQQEAARVAQEYSERRHHLQQQRDDLRLQLEEAREQSRRHQRDLDELHMQLRTSNNQVQMLQQNVERSERQLASLQEQLDALNLALSQATQPVPALKTELEGKLENRLSIEQELTTVKQAQGDVEQALRDLEGKREDYDEEANEIRAKLEQQRIHLQSLTVRRTTHQENIVEAGFELEAIAADLPSDSASGEWQAQIERVERRIQRLGPINLAAIDEHTQLSERKAYLDSQHEDLLAALDTLENAIRKIDKETKTRFRETFDQVNAHFGRLFPKVFGGGRAVLELTDDDLLNTGVIVRAQPPGKRNTSIHLLSGGEKALTAISLVFSLFQLSPAPFCILDEVDAPLDDANVGRFCNLVKEMSEQVQFIFISHNKITISMAEQLAGVTMHEPGVSRLVAVDVNEAISMAEA